MVRLRCALVSKQRRRVLGPAAITGLLVGILLAPPAWSDEVPSASTAVPAAQPSEATHSGHVPPGVDPEGDRDHRRPEHGSLGNIGAKLADPTSNVWALQFNFQGPQFFDGDLNLGSPEVGGNVIFQPVLPFPLYGPGRTRGR
jgi:hypothetical protein